MMYESMHAERAYESLVILKISTDSRKPYHLRINLRVRGQGKSFRLKNFAHPSNYNRKKISRYIKIRKIGVRV